MTGLLSKLNVGETNRPLKKTDGNAVSFFFSKINGNGLTLLKLNVLTLLFFAPAAAWFLIVTLTTTADSYLIPYSANIGVGWNVVTDAVDIGIYRAFLFETRRWLIMMPLLLIASIGLAGLFYSLKMLVRGEQGVGAKTFFVGIKKHWFPFLMAMVPIVLALFDFVFWISAYNSFTWLSPAVRIILMIVAGLLLVFAASFGIFLGAQCVTYELSAGALILNSLIFTLSLIHRSIVILVLGSLILTLLFLEGGFLTSMAIVFYLLIGISMTVLAFTVYTQWAFDRYMNPKIAELEKARLKEDGEDRKSKKQRLKEARLKSKGKIVGTKKEEETK